MSNASGHLTRFEAIDYVPETVLRYADCTEVPADRCYSDGCQMGGAGGSAPTCHAP